MIYRTCLVAFIVCQIMPFQLAFAREVSSFPVPRFVSLRADEVNLRAGPGVQYPVEWVYRREQLPFEVIAEFETWRKVRDWQGTQGWVHQSMLSGKRTFIVTGAERFLRAKSSATSIVVARVEPGVIGSFEDCDPTDEWCRVRIAGYFGWLRRSDIWGIYRGEMIN